MSNISKLVAGFLATSIVGGSGLLLQPGPEWTARYNGSANGDDVANAVVVDVFGNTIVAGQAEETSQGLNAVTRSYSPSGSLNWSNQFDGAISGDDGGVALVVDKTGNTYVAVTSEGDGTGKDLVVLKIAPDGDFSSDWSDIGQGQGVRRYDHDESEEIAYDIALDNDGNVYVTGTTDGNATGLDTLTIKVTAGGTLNPIGWPQTYNYPSESFDEAARAIAVDSDDFVVIPGYGRHPSTEGVDQYLTIRYEPDGDTASNWPQYYALQSGKHAQAYDVAADSNGDIFVTGTAITGTKAHFTTIS